MQRQTLPKSLNGCRATLTFRPAKASRRAVGCGFLSRALVRVGRVFHVRRVRGRVVCEQQVWQNCSLFVHHHLESDNVCRGHILFPRTRIFQPERLSSWLCGAKPPDFSPAGTYDSIRQRVPHIGRFTERYQDRCWRARHGPTETRRSVARQFDDQDLPDQHRDLVAVVKKRQSHIGARGSTTDQQ